MSERSYTDTANTRPLLFGDLVENPAASPDNPTRCGYFVRRGVRSGKLNPGPFAEITDGRGKFWESRIETLIVIERDRIPTVAQPAGMRTALQYARSELSYIAKRHGYVSTETAIKVVDDALASLSTLPRAAGCTAWQPIETAPKDGGKVDLWITPPQGALTTGDYRRVSDCWFSAGSWWFYDETKYASDSANCRSEVWNVTHWMPRPPSPYAAIPSTERAV